MCSNPYKKLRIHDLTNEQRGGGGFLTPLVLTDHKIIPENGLIGLYEQEIRLDNSNQFQ